MSYENPTVTETLLIALVGFITVFVVLIVLMCIIMLISKLFGEKQKTAEPVPAAPAPEPGKKDEYTGVKLNGVDDKTAAMLMAIVASRLEKPLDELRFVSIREVK